MALILCQKPGNSFLTEHLSSVIRCVKNTGNKVRINKKNAGFLVYLEDTILFPKGGGQPEDRGLLNDINVFDVFRDENGDVAHLLDKEIEKGTGNKIDTDLEKFKIVLIFKQNKKNRKRRFDHMQQHSAQHLISAIAKKNENFNANTISWNLGEKISFIDLDVKEFSEEKINQLEEECNEIIRLAKPVTVKIVGQNDLQNLPEEIRSRGLPSDVEDIRLIDIEGIDLNTCCGTHIESTSNLQIIKFLGTEKNKGLIRLNFIAGNRVISSVDEWSEKEKKMNKIFKTEPSKHLEIAEKILQDSVTINREKKALEKEYSLFLGKQISQNHKNGICIFEKNGCSLDFLQNILYAIKENQDCKIILLLNGTKKQEGNFILLGPEEFISKNGKTIVSKLGGKGGGKGEKIVGKCKLENLEETEKEINNLWIDFQKD